jgi:branched-chain amino acid transport system permease protein
MIAAILVAGLLQGGVYALISIGLTLMFGVLRVVNFAHGDLLMVAMYLTFIIGVWLGWDPLLALFLTVPLFLVGGVLLYHVVIRRTFNASAPLLAQVFATVGLSIVLQNVVLLIAGADVRDNASQWASGAIAIGSLRLQTVKVVVLVCTFMLGGALSLFLYRTTLGKQMRAVAQNANAATLMGIDVQRVYAWTFAISCGAVGLAGTLLSTTVLAYPTVGTQFALLCFMTVVIGGLGSIRGAILGGLLIGVAEAAARYVLGPIFAQAFVYLIFLAVLLLRPSGLFGQEGYLEAKAE